MAHYELQDWEADDIIGTLAKQAEAAGWETTVITGDRDLTQLATDHVTVQVTKKKASKNWKPSPLNTSKKKWA